MKRGQSDVSKQTSSSNMVEKNIKLLEQRITKEKEYVTHIKNNLEQQQIQIPKHYYWKHFLKQLKISKMQNLKQQLLVYTTLCDNTSFETSEISHFVDVSLETMRISELKAAEAMANEILLTSLKSVFDL